MSLYKFSPSTTPPQKVLTDVASLGSLTNDQLISFMQIAFSFLSFLEDSEAKLDAFAIEHKIKPQILTGILQSFLFVLSESVKYKLKGDDVYLDLVGVGLTESHAETIKTQYDKFFATVSGLRVDNIFKINRLINLEWRFGVTTASNELFQVGSCFLQIKLALQKNNTTENVIFEMTLAQFYSFLASLEQAAAEVKSISS